jgi:hypothetical protein
MKAFPGLAHGDEGQQKYKWAKKKCRMVLTEEESSE